MENTKQLNNYYEKVKYYHTSIQQMRSKYKIDERMELKRVVELDSGYFYAPYIPMETISFPEIKMRCFEEEKKNWYEFFKRNENRPIVYFSRKSIKYDAVILKVNKCSVDLKFKMINGKWKEKFYVSYYYESKCGLGRTWKYKDES